MSYLVVVLYKLYFLNFNFCRKDTAFYMYVIAPGSLKYTV